MRSSTPGQVVIDDYNDTMGNWIGVYFARDDVTITYWHLSKRFASLGDTVRTGTLIGRVGDTGNSTAPHLHVQVNPGRGFNYHAHVPPGPWVIGPWARLEAKVRRDVRQQEAIRSAFAPDPDDARMAAEGIIAREGFEVEAQI